MTVPRAEDTPAPAVPAELAEDITEDTVTDAVVESFAGAPDARLRELLGAVVRHLHAAVRETEPTMEEWEAAIDFLDGQIQLRVTQLVNRRRQLPLELRARQLQRLERPHLLGIPVIIAPGLQPLAHRPSGARACGQARRLCPARRPGLDEQRAARRAQRQAHGPAGE